MTDARESMEKRRSPEEGEERPPAERVPASGPAEASQGGATAVGATAADQSERVDRAGSGAEPADSEGADGKNRASDAPKGADTKSRTSSAPEGSDGNSPPQPQPPPRLAQLGPTSAAWREQALADTAALQARANEIALDPQLRTSPLLAEVAEHLEAARACAAGDPKRKRWARLPAWAGGADVERTMCNVDNATAALLRLSDVDYLCGQMPALVAHTRQHLLESDPRRTRMDELAAQAITESLKPADQESVAAIFSDACVAARGEVRRVRSFRNVLLATAAALTLLAGALAVIGASAPTALPLCFPHAEGPVCPRGSAVTRLDVPMILFVGLLAAAISAAAALSGIKGTSTPFGVPVALAVLKLPTGALTAVLGLMLMQGEFVPGLSALDFPAQIVAWAAVFGYAQQLFTRLVDRQAHRVLNDVGGASSASPPATSPNR